MIPRLLSVSALFCLVAAPSLSSSVTAPFADCNGNGISDERDIFLGTSMDCDLNSIPDECDIANDPSLDCNGNGILDNSLVCCDLNDGFSFDCNLNGIPDECDVESEDCNMNGIPDECDIDYGYSKDCNNNNVPDECEGLGPSASTYCSTSPNSVGAGAVLELDVWASSCDTLVFSCRDLPSAQIGLCVSSLSPQSPGVPFGNGTRCVDLSGLSRLTDMASTQSGQVFFSISLTHPGWGGAGFGDHRYLQFYYRDPAAGGTGFNLSNAIDLTFPLY